MYTLNLNMAEKFGKFRMFFIPLSCPSEKNWRKYNRLNWCKNSDFGSFWGKWPEKGDFGGSSHTYPDFETRVYGWKSILLPIKTLYGCLSSPGARASMCTHQAHPPTFYNFWGPIFRSHLPLILRVRSQNDHGCACWVHILGPALGVNKGLIWVYKPSKFHVLTPLGSTCPRTPHFMTRIGTHLRIFFHIYMKKNPNVTTESCREMRGPGASTCKRS